MPPEFDGRGPGYRPGKHEHNRSVGQCGDVADHQSFTVDVDGTLPSAGDAEDRVGQLPLVGW